MPNWVRNRLFVLYACLLIGGVAGGAAFGQLSCNGSCDANVAGCTAMPYTFSQSCCRDEDADGVKHCIQCWRSFYMCPQSIYRLGPAHNCFGDPGNECP